MTKYLPLLLLFGCASPKWTIEKSGCESVVYIESVRDLSNSQYDKLYKELVRNTEDCVVTNTRWVEK